MLQKVQGGKERENAKNSKNAEMQREHRAEGMRKSKDCKKHKKS